MFLAKNQLEMQQQSDRYESFDVLITERLREMDSQGCDRPTLY